MAGKTLLIINPRAGRMRIKNELFRVCDTLDESGYTPTVVFTRSTGHARELAMTAAGFDDIVCTGGDGTLNEVISGVLSAGLKIPVGYLPLGSTNDFARSLGIPTDIEGAVDTIVHGVPRGIDVARFNDRYFLDVGFFGAFSRTARETPQDMKNVLGFFAYVLEGIKDLPSMNTVHLKVRTGGREIEGDYLVCAISNSRRLGGVTTLDDEKVKMDDGLFEMLLVPRPQTAARLAAYIKALRTGDLNCEGVTFMSTSRVEMICGNSEPWTLDGERAEWDGRAEIQVLPRAVELILPGE